MMVTLQCNHPLSYLSIINHQLDRYHYQLSNSITTTSTLLSSVLNMSWILFPKVPAHSNVTPMYLGVPEALRGNTPWSCPGCHRGPLKKAKARGWYYYYKRMNIKEDSWGVPYLRNTHMVRGWSTPENEINHRKVIEENEKCLKKPPGSTCFNHSCWLSSPLTLINLYNPKIKQTNTNQSFLEWWIFTGGDGLLGLQSWTAQSGSGSGRSHAWICWGFDHGKLNPVR